MCGSTGGASNFPGVAMAPLARSPGGTTAASCWRFDFSIFENVKKTNWRTCFHVKCICALDKVFGKKNCLTKTFSLHFTRRVFCPEILPRFQKWTKCGYFYFLSGKISLTHFKQAQIFLPLKTCGQHVEWNEVKNKSPENILFPSWWEFF